MTIRSKLRSALQSPESVRPFLGMTAAKAARLLRERRFARTAGYAAEVVTGDNPYYRYRRWRARGRYVPVDVQGHRLWVDATDPGISQTLLSYGVHEQCSTDAYRRELARLATEHDGDPVALDIGANLGYYCLLAADALGPDARVYAFEPVPANADLLACNVRQNGYADRVDVIRRAVADRAGPVELQLAAASNHHALRPPTDDAGGEAAPGGSSAAHDETAPTTEAASDGGSQVVAAPTDDAASAGDPTPGDGETLAVEAVTVPEFLDARDVDPADVAAVRMDLEGYEATVLESLCEVLSAPGPRVVHVELHPMLLSDGDKRDIVDALDGFEPASVVLHESALGVEGQRRWHGEPLAVDTLDGLRKLLFETVHSVELVARKPA